MRHVVGLEVVERLLAVDAHADRKAADLDGGDRGRLGDRERRPHRRVGADRRDREGLAARREHRPAGGQVVGARARAGRDDQAVARDRVEVLVVDVQLEQRHLLAVAGHHEGVEDHVLDGPQRGQRLVAAFELDANGRHRRALRSGRPGPASGGSPSARAARAPESRTGRSRCPAPAPRTWRARRGRRCRRRRGRPARRPGPGLRRSASRSTQPGAHALGERDGFRLAGIGDDAEPARRGLGLARVRRAGRGSLTAWIVPGCSRVRRAGRGRLATDRAGA